MTFEIVDVSTISTTEFWMQLNDFDPATGSFEVQCDGTTTCFKATSVDNYRLTFQGGLMSEFADLNNWHHYAIIYGGQDKLYIDGRLVGDPGTHVGGAFAPKIVMNAAAISMKQFRMWNRVLSVEEIKIFSRMRLDTSVLGLCSIYTFEPYDKLSKGFPIYLRSVPDTVKNMVVKPEFSSISQSDTPLLCDKGEYFAGTTCKPSVALHIQRGVTPGIEIPMKSRARKNFDWTLETWVYAYDNQHPSYKAAAIMSLEGSNTKLNARLNDDELISELIYDTVGTTHSLSTFGRRVWHHVAVMSRLNAPYYESELVLDGTRFTKSSTIIQSNTATFDTLYLGMDKNEYYKMDHLSLKEIRVWNVALDRKTVAYYMQRQIRNPDLESRLIYYYPFDEVNAEKFTDKSFEGDLQVNRLWSTSHSYKTSPYSDPDNLIPPKVEYFSEMDIDTLQICDESSFFNSIYSKCQKDDDDMPIGLELSASPFTIPLTKYAFSVEWTFEFWILINQISGVSTSIFSQTCYPQRTGTISLRKVGVTNNLEFALAGTGYNITFAQENRRWIHYAFVNNGITGKIYGYKDGVLFGEMTGLPMAIPSCTLNVAEFSTMNVIFGKIKELRIWNSTKTATEINRYMHQKAHRDIDTTLGFYLPLSEGYGSIVTEVVKETQITLGISKYTRETWTAQGDLRICRSPLVYNSLQNICICIF